MIYSRGECKVIDLRDVSDEFLAVKAKHGGDVEFAALLARYIFLIKRRASFYNSADTEQEDLVQEGMVGFLKAVRAYEPDGGASFRTFSGLCIDRSIMTAVRSSLAKKQVPCAVRVSIEDTELESPITPETIVIARDEVQRLVSQLKSVLSDFERTVFLLYADGLSYRDIADKLGIDEKSADNALQRVRRKITR